MKYFWLLLTVMLAFIISGCRPENVENRTEEESESIVFNTQPEASSDDLFFTEKEVTQIETEVLNTVAGVWDQYENLIYDDSPDANASGIADFTKEQRLSVAQALGSEGVVVYTEDADTRNGDLLAEFYDNYRNHIPGRLTIYKVYNDGLIGTNTFLYRDEEIQTWYLGIKMGADKMPQISGQGSIEIASITYTEKGSFIYEYKRRYPHTSPFVYFRVSPLSDECRSLTKQYLADLEFQKYDLMITDWNEETVAELLKPGIFEDFYYIRFHETFKGDNHAIPGDLFEEVLTTCLPVTVEDLRSAYTYNEEVRIYSQETIYHSPYPPFLEVMDYEFRPDGTITLYTDAVWPEKKTDCAFSNVIVVQPFEDGSFRILSNEVEETELVKKLKGKW